MGKGENRGRRTEVGRTPRNEERLENKMVKRSKILEGGLYSIRRSSGRETDDE